MKNIEPKSFSRVVRLLTFLMIRGSDCWKVCVTRLVSSFVI